MHVFVPSAFPSLLTQRMGAISDVIIASATAGHVDGVVVKLPALVLSTAAAIGERQIFPRQTISTLNISFARNVSK